MKQVDFLQEIQEADMILVGLGEEFDAVKTIRDKAFYREGYDKLLASSQSSLIPLWQQLYRDQVGMPEIEKGLLKLAECLKGKNYYVVSVSTNAVIRQIPWRHEYLVMPCGSNAKLQCSGNMDTDNGDNPNVACVEHLQLLTEEKKQELLQKLAGWQQGGCEGAVENWLGVCEKCGAQLELNNIYSADYDEAGYMDDWTQYRKWLQGTINKKLLILELGVGMKYPSVIRFPFEKVAFFNEKAKMIRVNENLYQMTEELAAKGVGIANNAIDCLNNL